MDYFWTVFLSWSSITNIADSLSLPLEPENFGQLSRSKCLEYYPMPKNILPTKIDNFRNFSTQSLGPYSKPRFVAGGTETLPGSYPHMAVLGYGDEKDKQWGCGGSLISKKFVLTAAHCFDKNIPKYVRLGDWDLTSENDNTQPQDFSVGRIIIHPCYKPPVKYHDIALLELDREAEFTRYVSPACLNTKKEFSETKLLATGWGKIEFGGFSSNILLEVKLDYVRHDQCGNHSPRAVPKGVDDDIQLCAGKERGKDTCQGDSGGPLQVKNFERSFGVNVHNIFGITSFGKPCGLEGTPALYTRISGYIPWIESIAWQYEAGNNKSSRTTEIIHHF